MTALGMAFSFSTTSGPPLLRPVSTPLVALHTPSTFLTLPPPVSRNAAQLHRGRTMWRQVKCTYSTSSSSPEFNSSPIDVVADVKSQKILVLGGSGFVGTAVCKAGTAEGFSVVSLSRSGRPSYLDSWVDKVTWVSGDVFLTDWDSLLDGVQAVVSTLGGFGTNEQMERLNGDANIIAVNAAKKAGVPKFIYVSVHDYNLPPFVLNTGYFIGKRKAELEILSAYPNSGTILRPGPIYGKRRVNGVDIPVDLVGEPLERVLAATATLTRPLQNLPASDLLLTPPINVDNVALAAVKALEDDSIFGVFTIEQINEMAKA